MSFPVLYTHRVAIAATVGNDKIAAEQLLRKTLEDIIKQVRPNGLGEIVQLDLYTHGTDYDLKDHQNEIRAKAKAEIEAIFTLADIKVIRVWELPNGYTRESKTPWFLVRTPYGLIQIGWRKRVLAIDWIDTGVLGRVTSDDVTQDSTSVHAWTVEKAVEYMKDWKKLAELKKAVDTKNELA